MAVNKYRERKGALTRQFGTSLLNFHKNHVIQCPNPICKSHLTRYYATRSRASTTSFLGHAEVNKLYTCALCGYTFACCNNRHDTRYTVRKLAKLVSETKARLAHYEKQLEVYYH